MRKKIVVLTGAGVSAESGISTFRDSNGLWENHRIQDVATPEAWQKDPILVQRFYNLRRKQLFEVEPNIAHKILARLENYFDVTIITQNVDNLHERAGSTKVLHLHGELAKARSSKNIDHVYPIDGWEIKMGDVCPKDGSQLRPHIVWFGEAVPMMEKATEEAMSADIFIVIGTSLLVYPAAGLIDVISDKVPKFIIDPNMPTISTRRNLSFIPETATVGMRQIEEMLLNDYI
ncbi:MAG: NAD-dependent deacylase [Bernardetiaceae bacterium]|nr:NAD-dependent deacylase [Bernardetiaceae bacterium]